jgi:hypothetical protein
LDLSLGLPSATFRLPSFVDCLLCSRTNIARHKRLCGQCETEQARTPLRKWRWASGTSLVQLQQSTGLTKRTLLRADAGDRMSVAVARVLSRHTGIPAIKFREGDESL